MLLHYKNVSEHLNENIVRSLFEEFVNHFIHLLIR